MEDKLDAITNDNTEWSSICRECYNEIKELSKPVSKIPKQTYPLDDKHVVLFEKYGPVIQYKNEEDKYEYISVKRNFKIDVDKLKNKEYTIEDLIASFLHQPVVHFPFSPGTSLLLFGFSIFLSFRQN